MGEYIPPAGGGGGWNGSGVKLATQFYLIPRLRMSGATPPIPHGVYERNVTFNYLLINAVVI
jgi:hypothetical protein